MQSGDSSAGSERMALDSLVARVRDPDFAARHRREVTLRDTGAHVNPVMLAASTRDSLYVRAWRRHARRCEACARLFSYFRIHLEA